MRVASSGPDIEQTPPPNVYGAKPFLLKLQISTDAANMMLYDRQRNMQGYFVRADDPMLFRDVREEMEGPRGGHAGLKMYRVCKRVGDFELSVCVDREPSEPVRW